MPQGLRVRVSLGPPNNGAFVYRSGPLIFIQVRGVQLSYALPNFSTQLKAAMSYNRDLETDREAKRKHDEMLKKNASDRLRRNADWNKKNKN